MSLAHPNDLFDALVSENCVAGHDGHGNVTGPLVRQFYGPFVSEARRSCRLPIFHRHHHPHRTTYYSTHSTPCASCEVILSALLVYTIGAPHLLPMGHHVLHLDSDTLTYFPVVMTLFLYIIKTFLIHHHLCTYHTNYIFYITCFSRHGKWYIIISRHEKVNFLLSILLSVAFWPPTFNS